MTHLLKNTSGQGNKVLVRWKPGMVIGSGQHIVCFNGKGVPYIYGKPLGLFIRHYIYIYGKPLGLFIRHYPFRSKEHIRQKIIKGGQAFAVTQGLPEQVGNSWKEWYIQYQLRGEEYIDKFYHSYLNGYKDAVYDPAIK